MKRVPGISVVIALGLCLAQSALAQGPYKSFDEARSAGARLVRGQQFAEAQAPLEAALKMAPDDAARLSIYQMLVSAYRVSPEIDKKVEANEFVIRHTDRRPGRSLAARDLASFLHQRGKLDEAIERYEAKIKEDPEDVAALSVMAIIYAQLRRDKAKADEYAKQLEHVDKKIARGVAQRLEQQAEASPALSASLFKDAAQLWLEAGEKAKAVAAAKRSASSPPEKRSTLLTFYWHDGLGDVFLSTAEPQLAVGQFESALAVALEHQRKPTQAKLDKAKEAAALKP